MADDQTESPIQLRLVSTSLGLKIPYTPIGVSVLSSTYLQFKMGKDTYLYGIGVPIDAGSGALFIGSVATDYFTIRHNAKRQARIPRMHGLEAEIKISGLVVGGYGKIDIDLQVFDEFADKNNPLLKVNRQNQAAEGILAFDLTMSGTLLKFEKKKEQGD
ncbi:hypothetical protein [Roseospira goensis]|uniref:Uncharacterized protein n=1 Tax=Roseospira goensis TaxID=391922 RepID=A0A7W6S108_9PROT|nr:hypothetical protein [Roseospira goensis]MBB4286879.1 hypothetical protein [Roseospira goensis]